MEFVSLKTTTVSNKCYSIDNIVNEDTLYAKILTKMIMTPIYLMYLNYPFDDNHFKYLIYTCNPNNTNKIIVYKYSSKRYYRDYRYEIPCITTDYKNIQYCYRALSDDDYVIIRSYNGIDYFIYNKDQYCGQAGEFLQTIDIYLDLFGSIINITHGIMNANYYNGTKVVPYEYKDYIETFEYFIEDLREMDYNFPKEIYKYDFTTQYSKLFLEKMNLLI
jgi:hypothetical protein